MSDSLAFVQSKWGRLTGPVLAGTFGAWDEAIKGGRERGGDVYQRRAGVYGLRKGRNERKKKRREPSSAGAHGRKTRWSDEWSVHPRTDRS